MHTTTNLNSAHWKSTLGDPGWPWKRSVCSRSSCRCSCWLNGGSCLANVYFAIDTSESVAMARFPWGSLVSKLIDFLSLFVERLEQSSQLPRKIQWAYGGLHFSSHVEVFSPIVQNPSPFLARARAIRYIGKGTFIDCALRNVTEQVRLRSPVRPVLQYAVVLTDGHMTGSPCGGVQEAAEAAKAAGIKIFVVATNQETVEGELRLIASSPAAKYRKDYQAFPSAQQQEAVNRITSAMVSVVGPGKCRVTVTRLSTVIFYFTILYSRGRQ
ncbi:collagen alpha-2(VI) chain-like [Astyanax mexicanus]|uniref:Collagen alpha-2(VI) chain-like n=1 Tax=Astyanax mexicanus TaxID=7994 RepID=A0A8T2MH70_ASTMX|nr:collagen alpha-2(VI) chain-like [Astyanax mexicanus]